MAFVSFRKYDGTRAHIAVRQQISIPSRKPDSLALPGPNASAVVTSTSAEHEDMDSNIDSSVLPESGTKVIVKSVCKKHEIMAGKCHFGLVVSKLVEGVRRYLTISGPVPYHLVGIDRTTAECIRRFVDMH